MKIGYMSDLHLRVNRDYDQFIKQLDPQVDLQIIAGDCIDGTRDIGLLRELLSRFKMPVIFVPGNHEYYLDESPKATEHRLAAMHDMPNVRVLISDAWQVPNGPRIVGTTLWYRSTLDFAMRWAAWADFRYIKNLTGFTEERFIRDNALVGNIVQGDIVVTHMLPSQRCVDPRFEHSNTNEVFVRNVEPIISDNKPAFWIHGHTHCPVDITIGETRVLCNPRGNLRDYGPENPLFNVSASFDLPGPV